MFHINIKNLQRIAIISTVLVLGACTHASEATAKIYEIDAGHTHVSFSVNRFEFANTLGIFPTSSGEITIDIDNPENSSVQASVTTKDVWSGLAARDDAIRGKAWLNVQAFNEITFTSTSVTLGKNDGKHATVVGDLTIWGQSLPVSFDVTLNHMGPDRTAQGREAIGFTMDATIKRSSFGHKTALKFVGDDVRIHIETIAHLKAE